MLWLNFLHIYQPPTLDKEFLRRIADESYLNIIKILKQNPRHKITLNISACLTEYLHQIGQTKLITDIKKLVDSGQIELVGSAAFHPFLPLLPIKEVKRQIQVNYNINRQYFGRSYNPRGFYLPEMAYSAEVARVIKRAGYSWIILDEIALDGKISHNHIDYNAKYTLKNIGLDVIFRNRRISKTYVPEAIQELLKKQKRPEVVITATDGELYGHKYIDRQNIINKILHNKILQTTTISEFLSQTKKSIKIDALDCSWESTPAELKNNIPYSLWNHPKNIIHKSLWQLANLALELNYKHTADPNHFASRLHMEKGLASCTFWWASDKDFKTFEHPAWNPEEVEKGALELLRSVRSLVRVDYKIKIKAEKIFLKIHEKMWSKHWSKFKNADKGLLERLTHLG